MHGGGNAHHMVFMRGESPGISTSHLLTLGLHPWLAGVMPCCCGFLLYINILKGKFHYQRTSGSGFLKNPRIKEPLVLGFQKNFQNQRTSGSGFLKIFKESKGFYERISKELVVRIRASSLIAPLSFQRDKVMSQNQFFDF
jgi:hypothetical protein